MSTIEVKVPDIGDFKDVPVIEILVKPGDTVAAEDSLVTLESDKATMDVPAPTAGTVKSICVKVGDKVSEGTLLLALETAAEAAPAPRPAAAAAPAPSAAAKPQAAAPSPAAAAPRGAEDYRGHVDLECQMVVIGAGPGGYSGAFRAADLGLKTVLIERYPILGGVCLNVGCIPSKALLHAAKVIDEAEEMSHFGVTFGKPSIDLARLRGWKDAVIARLTGGLAGLAKQRKVTVATGVARFVDAHHVEVSAADGTKRIVKFEHCIIAAGSQAVKLPFIPDDPRVVDSTGALDLKGLPKHMLVIGGGIIGMEMAQVYSALGARISVVEMLSQLMTGADPDLVRPFARRMEKRYDKIMLKTRVTRVEAQKEGLKVWFEGDQAPAAPQVYDSVLVAVGRSPNGKKIGAEHAGVAVDDHGFIPVDGQLRTNVAHIFAIGDVARQPMLAHKAVHEAHVAAEAAAGEKSWFDARVIPSVAYTDPEVAWVGVTEEQARAEGIKLGKATFPWAASGRSLSLGRDEGMTKLLFDQDSHRIVGGGIVGPNAGDLIAEVALAIEMGCNAEDIGRTIHPHPTLSETIGMAAEAFAGTITDLYIPKRK
ncbi:MAG TPA: dihydrolipoyl dehydrogenase [Casimicrobiaceae bacterium]|jgi:dihydrolipoamide dehydrogenase